MNVIHEYPILSGAVFGIGICIGDIICELI